MRRLLSSRGDPPRLISRSLVAVALGLIAVNCGDGASSPDAPFSQPMAPPAPIPAAITIEPGSLALVEGDSGRFSATVQDAAGRKLALPVDWRASDSTVVRIGAYSGQVWAIRPGGPVSVTASVQSIQSKASVTVQPAPVAGGTVFVSADRVPFAGGSATRDIVAIDVASGVLTDLTPWNYDQEFPKVSPDGQTVLFRSFYPSLPRFKQPMLIGRDGSGFRALRGDCTERCVLSPTWLKDSRLAFVEFGYTPTFGASFVIENSNATSVEAYPVFSTMFQDASDPSSFPSIAFSATGARAAYQDAGATYSIKLAEGRRVRVLPPCDYPKSCAEPPVFLPSGEEMLVIRQGTIVRVRLDGSGPITFYSSRTGGMREMAMSPDGTQLAFLEFADLVVLPIAGGSSLSKTLAQKVTAFAWSPDSKSLAFLQDTAVYTLANVLFNILDVPMAINVTGLGRRRLADPFRGTSGIAWGK